MKVGLIDADNWEHLKGCFPNLPLMKISSWHKKNGDQVEWYDPLFGGHYQRVYISKVFSFTPEYPYYIDADEIFRGGTGYAIKMENGKEVFHEELHKNLPEEIEHIYPDYSLYEITDTAYGFMSRGCPRGCSFCHVKEKEGLCSRKVADLNEFWNGQEKIMLCDPNVLACKDWKDILQQLIDSKAKVNFNQGLDIRMMTDEKAEMLKLIKRAKGGYHFAYDRWKDKDIIEPRLKMFAEKTGLKRWDVSVYVLCNFDTTIEQDIHRCEYIIQCGFTPYPMFYNKGEYCDTKTGRFYPDTMLLKKFTKEQIEHAKTVQMIQRWCKPQVLYRCKRFEDYKR